MRSCVDGAASSGHELFERLSADLHDLATSAVRVEAQEASSGDASWHLELRVAHPAQLVVLARSAGAAAAPHLSLDGGPRPPGTGYGELLRLRGCEEDTTAARLSPSRHTVRDHIETVFEKVGVSSRPELVARLFAEHHSERAHADRAHS